VRAVVLPSLMAMLGRANWWPSSMSRRPRWTALDPQRDLVDAGSH
jgi:uncharacterized membrane protein YdfJ with MMPL/SSD domain